MARAKVSVETPVETPKTTQGPVIEYFGEGAEDLKVEIDPKAIHVRVYSTGLVISDY